MIRWKILLCTLGLLTTLGCSGKVAKWFEDPVSFDEKVQQMRDVRTEFEPIVESNEKQRIQWRTEWSKKYHKMRQFYNPEYQDYRHLCLPQKTLDLYREQYRQVKRERVNRSNPTRTKGK